MGRKSAIAVITVACILGTTNVSGAALMMDSADAPENEAIQELLDRGVIEGYSDGTFRPLQTINRAEFLKILIGSRWKDHVPSDLKCFLDLEVKVPQWYARSVCAAQEMGIVSGYPDGTFKPDREVSLGEALKMAFLSFGIFPENSETGEWYEKYLFEARNRGMLIHLLKSPSHLLTRGEMAALTFALILDAEQKAEQRVVTTTVCGNGTRESQEQCDDGNTVDSDGCSSICILVPEPIRMSILQIDAQASGSVTSIAQGQTGVPLLKFTVTAGRQDALLTSLTFTPTVGSLVYGKKYTLRMDRKGTGSYDTLVQSDGKTDGSTLTFDTLLGKGIVIPKGLSIPFVLTADLVSTLGPVTLGVNFATSLQGYVQAMGAEDSLTLTGIETNNVCTDDGGCFIRVNTQATKDITVVEAGSLFLTEDSSRAVGHILLGGSQTPLLLRLRLHATGEEIDLHELRIDGVPSGVDSLLLYALSPGQSQPLSTPFAQASTGQCSSQVATRVCAILPLRTLLVSPNLDIVIGIAAKMKNDEVGGVSGDTMTLSVAAATSDAGLSVKARGISSRSELAQNNGDSTALGEVFVGTSSPAGNNLILGRTNDTALASISSVTNAGEANSTFIPTGNTTIGSFKIDALPHGNAKNGSNDVVLKTMVFSVSAQNVQIDPMSLVLISSNDPNAEHSCSASGTTGTITVTCSTIDQGSIQARISQGQWVFYKLKANITNTQITQGTSSLVVTLPTLGTRSDTNSILWSDEVTTFTWVDIPVSSVSSTVFQTR